MFIQSCYIKKNTVDLQQHLQLLGYTFINKRFAPYILCFSYKNIGIADYFSDLTFISKDDINCHTNEKLFKAVSALRDDSDYMQYFVSEIEERWVNQGIYKPRGSFELCLVDKYPWENAHKATLEELIKYFR